MLMLVRAIETVCVSTQRAFERYGAAIRISLFTRVITVAAAVVLSIRGFGVAGIMEATACFLVLGTLAQLIRLQQYLGAASLLPSFDRNATTCPVPIWSVQLAACGLERYLYPGGPAAPGRLAGRDDRHCLRVVRADGPADLWHRFLRAAFSVSLSCGAECSLTAGRHQESRS